MRGLEASRYHRRGGRANPTYGTGKSSMLWWVKRDEGHSRALERVRQWTRARFRLAEETTVLVSEVACGMPGCPPIETVIAFWADGNQRHHWKVFKPVAEVLEDDLPPWWMKPALIVPEGAEFDCGC